MGTEKKGIIGREVWIIQKYIKVNTITNAYESKKNAEKVGFMTVISSN